MNNFSSLLLANHNVVDELVKVVYDDSEIVEDDQGQKRLLFISRYHEREIYFNEHGMVLLYRAAIADLLGIDKTKINKRIEAMESDGFFERYPDTIVQLTLPTALRPVAFYSEMVITLIASESSELSQQIDNFFLYLHQMKERYQDALIQLMAADYSRGYQEGFQQGFADGQANRPLS